MLIGISLDALEKHVALFIEEFLPQFLNVSAIAELRRCQHLGYYTAIFSNSPDFIVKPIAEYLNVDNWKATSYAVDKHRKLQGISNILTGEQKAQYLKQLKDNLHVDSQNVIAYSDSYADLPFLLASGQPVAVNPDKKLKAYAESHQWSII